MASTSNRFAALQDLADQLDEEFGHDAFPRASETFTPSPPPQHERGSGIFSQAFQTHLKFLEFWVSIQENLDGLTLKEVSQRLDWLKVEHYYLSEKAKRRKLAKDFKKETQTLCAKMARQFRTNRKNKYYFDYLVVIDFEATCDMNNPDDFQHEIIQFPAVLIDVHRQEIVDEFNAFCKPRMNPTLSSFCTSLTGISQESIDSARDFGDVLEDFTKWLDSHGLGSKHSFSLVSDGFCDMGKFMYTQCLISGIDYPTFALQWIDIRLLFFNFYGVKWYKLPISLELLGERFHGTLHNGLDDSRNIGAILLRILRAGGNPIQNERILLDPKDQQDNSPARRYDLRTVQYIQPKEFFLIHNRPHLSGRLRTWSLEQVQDGSYTSNKENWYHNRSHLATHVHQHMFPSPPPIPRFNKLNHALRNSYTKNNNEDEPSSSGLQVEKLSRRSSKSESS